MLRQLAAIALLPVIATACDSGGRAPAPSAASSGPLGVVRVALREVRWPLDPAFVENRDEITLARALLATPLRTDPVTGALRPGLCAAWYASDGLRVWRFRCRHAGAIAVELRRVRGLRASPSRWLFADATRIDAVGDVLVVRLRHPWVRFPYALTAVAAAPSGVPGPFRVTVSDPGRIDAVGPGVALRFRQMSPYAAAAAFRRREVDDAPVPLGDLRAVRLDPGLRGEVHVRPLLGVDLVAFHGLAPRLRRAYWLTADRTDYEALVPEYAAHAAYGLVPQAASRGGAAAFRRARDGIPLLPQVAVPLAVPADPDLAYGARLVVAQWRELGLGPFVARRSSVAQFRRVIAPYPQSEALFGAALRETGPLRPALAAERQDALLARLDDELDERATVVPLAWVVSARLVSPRLVGWRQDALGAVDYAEVRARAASPSR